MAKQTTLYDMEDAPKKTDNLRKKWENGFQRWCNKALEDGSSPDGKCGCGIICDYCEDNTYGRPCVRALNAMCRDSRITIDYENTSYENAWEGEFDNG